MECVTVPVEDYSQTILDFKEKGMMLSMVSTSGVEEGQCRMTFMPNNILEILAENPVDCWLSTQWIKKNASPTGRYIGSAHFDNGAPVYHVFEPAE